MSKVRPDIKPPQKLSELIKLALHDLELCEAQPEVYVIEPRVWHSPPRSGGKCHICFAGAIMAQTFHTNPLMLAHYGSYGERWVKCFLAVDCVRMGSLRYAARTFGIEDVASSSLAISVDVGDMAEHPAEFKAAMREIISILEARGL